MTSRATVSPSSSHRQASIHPWVGALELFSIPFMCYGDGAQRTYLSPAACSFVRSSRAGAALERQADWVVSEELGASRRASGTGQFALVRRLPVPAASVLLAVHVALPPVREISALVVLHPRDAGGGAEDELPAGTGLSPREMEVARLITAALATKEIAAHLRLSAHTVRHHTERIFSKLGVRSRAGVAAMLLGQARAGRETVA